MRWSKWDTTHHCPRSQIVQTHIISIRNDDMCLARALDIVCLFSKIPKGHKFRLHSAQKIAVARYHEVTGC